MSQGPDAPRCGDRAIVDDCWNRIGVRGDGSCPELQRHVHCRNCALYAQAAQALLDRTVPGPDEIGRSSNAAASDRSDNGAGDSIVLFRLGAEWFALPTLAVEEIAHLRAVHSLPHRRTGAVLGVVNVHGELLVCVTLARVLGLDDAQGPAVPPRRGHRRLLVLRYGETRVVCPADEVHGIHRLSPNALVGVPDTLPRGSTAVSKAVTFLGGRSVGVLDESLVFTALRRSLS